MKKALLAAMALGLVGVGQAQAVPNISQMSDAEFTQFLKKQTTEEYNNLPDDVKPIEAERINSKQEWIDEDNRKEDIAMCARGHCSSQPLLTKEQYQNAQATIASRDELHLRQMGLTPETAHNATWAMVHKPQSQCAVFAMQLVGDYNIGRTAPDMADPRSDDDSVIRLEESHICDRATIQ
ncbi:hypothetical protein [Saccharibacter floricola]|uniref:Uncharacterized protein n=1 Tax=Saccharibacter floricola DSM 15669 TaxID=1123227 RepID=A0ABQ0NZM1_9PROT|nr:hypothetical protein [Saccharibacter floricola]GBQ07264.1 hypothetical protein AA15669_1304 [Saccharibacter floricola DSM 15669]